jgi:predicted MFS family arabinose efflux permease
MSYILAPSLVPPRICTKASSLMALTYQVAHILGLCIAIGTALWLYGDISGGL